MSILCCNARFRIAGAQVDKTLEYVDFRTDQFVRNEFDYMNEFYFHLRSKGEIIQTWESRKLADLAAAHRHAMLIIRKLVSLDDMDWRGWSITVTERNRPVLSVLFPQIPSARISASLE